MGHSIRGGNLRPFLADHDKGFKDKTLANTWPAKQPHGLVFGPENEPMFFPQAESTGDRVDKGRKMRPKNQAMRPLETPILEEIPGHELFGGVRPEPDDRKADKRAKPPAIMVFAPSTLNYGQLMKFMGSALPTHKMVDVYLDTPLPPIPKQKP